MAFSDYSPIFQLLCGYNFVNAVNDTDALKFLDFTTPVKEKVRKTISTLSAQIKSLIDSGNGEDGETQAKLSDIYKYKHKSEAIEDVLQQHDIKVSNLYLIAGIFCFFILLFSGLLVDYRKFNSYIILFVGTIFLYLLFLLCDFAKKKNGLKYTTIIVLSIIIICLVLQQFKVFIAALNRSDNSYCILIISSSLLLLLILFRKPIVQRKAHKAVFIILFILFLFIPDTNLMYEAFYKKSNIIPGSNIFTFAVIIIIISLFPFIYDIMRHSSFAREISVIAEEVNLRYVKTGLTKEGLGLSDREINPFNTV